ncbi:hypothetical protein VTK56DRAFT_3836 [Thermocarpiscus australiensis]
MPRVLTVPLRLDGVTISNAPFRRLILSCSRYQVSTTADAKQPITQMLYNRATLPHLPAHLHRQRLVPASSQPPWTFHSRRHPTLLVPVELPSDALLLSSVLAAALPSQHPESPSSHLPLASRETPVPSRRSSFWVRVSSFGGRVEVPERGS